MLLNINIRQFSFEQLENLKYLGTNINYKKNMHKEIKLRVSATN